MEKNILHIMCFLGDYGSSDAPRLGMRLSSEWEWGGAMQARGTLRAEGLRLRAAGVPAAGRSDFLHGLDWGRHHINAPAL